MTSTAQVVFINAKITFVFIIRFIYSRRLTLWNNCSWSATDTGQLIVPLTSRGVVLFWIILVIFSAFFFTKSRIRYRKTIASPASTTPSPFFTSITWLTRYVFSLALLPATYASNSNPSLSPSSRALNASSRVSLGSDEIQSFPN